MRLILAMLTAVFLTGCGCNSHKPQSHETAACMNYRSMMTAPMPPDAMQRLQERCAASRKG
ncbi:hypothetical protein JRX38_14245 [Gluconobacter cerinus]|uniref:hypothetical protein n=1 Tax=Gluconobacter cerinus TaxID=38307 RepID=UPI00193F2635|nr:hypothetical protein [Gluconobacter cerinus]MBM3099148.1 hypothetical protein [Gluconobacter cerinus]